MALLPCTRVDTRAAATVLLVTLWAGGVRASVAQPVPAPPQPSRTPDVNFVPTPMHAVEAMLDLAKVTRDDVVYDLGSGDGRIVIMAAEKYGARAVGLELDPALVAASRRAAREKGVADRVTFVEGDLFAADLSPATVVTMYLSSRINERLLPKLRRELKPGARVVSHDFDFRGLPTEKRRIAGGDEVFLWTVPRPPIHDPDTPFAPTPQPVVDEMLQLARVGAGDMVYDLGSGDGRVVVVAAQKYGAKGVGVEIDTSLVERSREVVREGGVEDKVTILEADLFTTDTSRATVVTLSLSAEVNARLVAKLKRELRPGTRIVSRQFGLDGWPPDRTIRAVDGASLFLWIVK
jgi:cyclopropane fatty-acyl-phospholipid synthase-like methyltransferase